MRFVVIPQRQNVLQLYLLLFITNFSSTQTLSSSFEHSVQINVLLRREWFSALFTRWDGSTGRWRCGGRAAGRYTPSLQSFVCTVRKHWNLLSHVTPPASLQLHPGRNVSIQDRNVLCPGSTRGFRNTSQQRRHPGCWVQSPSRGTHFKVQGTSHRGPMCLSLTS